jgi:hypothetical protein
MFEAEIPAYIKEVADQALASRTAHLEYRDMTQVPPPGYDHKKVVDAMHRCSVWFSGQHDIAHAKFKKYLDISK